ncbi:MAG: hypothetical protein Kow0079_09800 [Vicingaceae bacterium]
MVLNEETYTTEIAKISWAEKGIVKVEFQHNAVITIDDIKKLNETIGKLTDNKKAPILLIAGHYTTLTKEAREYAGTKEAVPYSIVEAYVIETLAQKILASFFISFNTPPVETKFYKSQEAALEWLRSFL